MHLICLYAIVCVIDCVVGVLMLHMIYSNVHVAFVPMTAQLRQKSEQLTLEMCFSC